MTTKELACPECADYDEDAEIGERYRLKKFNQFEQDAEEAGLELDHYHGRFFYRGPSASGDDLQELMSSTKVRLSSDSLGRGYIVYPA